MKDFKVMKKAVGGIVGPYEAKYSTKPEKPIETPPPALQKALANSKATRYNQKVAAASALKCGGKVKK